MSPEKIKVNLGCGPIGKDDWINIDYGVLAWLQKHLLIKEIALRMGIMPKSYDLKWPKNLVIHNCKKELPFKDNQVDYIYTSHLIEHFTKYEAFAMIKECFRILKPGGCIRVVVPDLELLARKYVERDRLFFNFCQQASSEDTPLADLFLSIFYPEKNRKIINSLLGRLYDKFTRWHRWHYDFDSLSLMLKAAGFIDIQKKGYREGKVPDLEYLDAHSGYSLSVEAEK